MNLELAFQMILASVGAWWIGIGLHCVVRREPKIAEGDRTTFFLILGLTGGGLVAGVLSWLWSQESVMSVEIRLGLVVGLAICWFFDSRKVGGIRVQPEGVGLALLFCVKPYWLPILGLVSLFGLLVRYKGNWRASRVR